MTFLSPLFRISRDGTMLLGILALPALVTLAARTARADEPPPATVPALAQVAPSASTVTVAGPAAAGGTVVELSADDGRATMERRLATISPSGLPVVETGLFAVGQWEYACVAPCTMKVDTRYTYRVAGDGLVPTESFGLPHSADRVRVDAKMGSSMGRVAGGLTTGMGIAAIAVGGLALIGTPILQNEDIGTKGFRTGVLAGGIGAVSVGVLAVGVGTFLWFSNVSTAHTQIASR
jgi:hypothetical protein